LLVKEPATKAHSDAPFLYYYAYERSAFITERADGTDSRVLANYKLPTENYVGGPGWSSSGKWFAWANFFGSGISLKESFTIWVVSRDGKQSHALLNLPGQIRSMQWSPTAELLLVEHINNHEVGDFEFDILDVESGKTTVVLYQPSAQIMPNGTIGIQPEWTPDGRFASFYYADDFLTDTRQYKMHLVTSDGNLVAERQLYSSGPGCAASVVFWSKTGSAVYLDPQRQTLIVEEFVTSKSFRWLRDSPIHWNSTEDKVTFIGLTQPALE
jgi:Tol biopolymer transport system component